MAGSVHGWTRRISAALSAALSVLIWQVVMGSEHATDGGRLIGAWPEIRGSSDPRHVLSEMGSVISARPTVAVAAAALAGGALVIPAVMRVRRGIPRTIAVGIWTTAIIGVIAVAGGSVGVRNARTSRPSAGVQLDNRVSGAVAVIETEDNGDAWSGRAGGRRRPKPA